MVKNRYENSEKEIRVTPRDSSFIKDFIYNKEKGSLEVFFKSGTSKVFINVPMEVMEELEVAESCGGYFNGNIKGTYEAL